MGAAAAPPVPRLMPFNLEYTGRAPLRFDEVVDAHRLLVSVSCQIEAQEVLIEALVDTASEWCVIKEDLLPRHAAESASERTMLSTRFGLIEGHLVRAAITFPGTESDDLRVEGTWFVSADWTGPPVLGWKGVLDRMRFAVDPVEGWLYFSEL
jgi:hypothetical protein